MISIIIPFLNEADNLRILLPNLLKQAGNQFELIFVNDGSTDTSEKVLFQELKKCKFDPHYQYIEHERQSGIGVAYRSALAVARGSHVCMLASDNEDNIEDIVKAVKFLQDFDVVMFYNANSFKVRSRFRRLLSLIFRSYLNYRFGVKALYLNAMGNLYPIGAIKSIEISSNGFFCLAEIVIKISGKTNSIVHIPRTLGQRSSGNDKALTLRSLLMIIADYLKVNFAAK